MLQKWAATKPEQALEINSIFSIKSLSVADGTGEHVPGLVGQSWFLLILLQNY